jgi:hypothetical protein
MIVMDSNKIINSTNNKYISDSKLKNTNNNIYSKIAPPNTFIRRNQNQILRGSKLFQRKEKSPKSIQMVKPFMNNSNIIKNNNSISKSHMILNDLKINSSYRDRARLISGNNIFNNNLNNSHNLIITPKKLLFTKIKIKGNKIDYNKYKTEKENTSNKKLGIEQDIKKILIINGSKNKKNIINIKNNDIKEKYDLLLDKTRTLLSNYQKIIDYYQEKEKNFGYKQEQEES